MDVRTATPRDALWLGTRGRHSAVVAVKACRDASIALSTVFNASTAVAYRVAIGAGNNSRLAIYTTARESAVAAHTPAAPPLDCSTFRTFWLSWRGGAIRVGAGANVGRGVLVGWTDPVPRSVGALAFSTAGDVNTQWMLSELDGTSRTRGNNGAIPAKVVVKSIL